MPDDDDKRLAALVLKRKQDVQERDRKMAEQRDQEREARRRKQELVEKWRARGHQIDRLFADLNRTIAEGSMHLEVNRGGSAAEGVIDHLDVQLTSAGLVSRRRFTMQVQDDGAILISSGPNKERLNVETFEIEKLKTMLIDYMQEASE